MKKLLLGLSLLVISSSCFAIVNFTSSNGTLVMRDVSVDGTTTYDSVTLQLNLANGTFTILDATLKDTSFSETVLATVSSNGVKVDLYGCALSGKNQITCKTKVISINQDQVMNVIGPPQFYRGASTSLFDNLSQEYTPSTLAALGKTDSSSLTFNIIQGIPVEVNFIFNNINPSATSIAAFKPYFSFDTGSFIADFRNIEF